MLGEYKLLIEYDGDHHRIEPMQWSRDIARHEAASNAGYTITRVTNGRMMQPEEIVATVHTRLVENGYRGPAPSLTTEWHDLFQPRRITE